MLPSLISAETCEFIDFLLLSSARAYRNLRFNLRVIFYFYGSASERCELPTLNVDAYLDNASERKFNQMKYFDKVTQLIRNLLVDKTDSITCLRTIKRRGYITTWLLS